jgi:LysR family transcriptional regulator, low CO2-responsive transcriptional regulator
MTFTQLRAFALVAELGSLRAAAAALGVSEPAVSAAMASLRSDLGDPLFERTATGIALTPGGRALAGHARDLVRTADRARREVASATTDGGRLRAVATAACAEHAAGPLVAAFTRRVPGVAGHVSPTSVECAATALADDLADIALGGRPAPLPGQELTGVPFLRYRRVLVAVPAHPLAGRTALRLADLAGHSWLTGPAGIEPGTAEEHWSASDGERPLVVRMDSEEVALAAARSGAGMVLALAHAVADDLRRGTLVRLPVAGTPVSGLWWATVAGHGAAPAGARALQRFLTTPDATTAVLGRPGRRRSRPTVRVELWS